MKKNNVFSNSIRFLDSYNRLDKALRDIYNIKPSLSYSDCIRRCAAVSSVIRKYEDDLIDYGRLRNAIVHRSTDIPIAEPHDDVVEKMESITRLVATPPLAAACLSNRQIYFVDAKETLGKVVTEMFKTGYSCIPVYSQSTLVGVINRKMIMDAIGGALMNNVKVDALFKQTVADSLNLMEISSHYEVVPDNITIDNLLYLFQQNKKLSVAILTKGGSYKEKPVGVVVTADTIDMQEILDNY